jgi:hypothetical protein
MGAEENGGQSNDGAVEEFFDRSLIQRAIVRPEGVEPPTYSSVGCRSIQLSYGRMETVDDNAPISSEGILFFSTVFLSSTGISNLRSANGIRTRISALRGRCPKPLDDSAVEISRLELRISD